ncbi:MAG: class I SAM-dependent methyltransferase [Rhodospirillales bacterium]|nr:class I SAM-dependent methyltransferase [Rhodospirillales bacterium]
MSRSMFGMSAELRAYLQSVSLRETPLQVRLREETTKLPMGGMQISPEQGQLMALLARLIGARLYVEVGTFTGYSALSVVQALPADGRAICCDVSEEWTAVARRYWKEAGVADRIELRLAPAVETLDALLAGGYEGKVDLAFVDADKTGYAAYVERIFRLLRPNGLLLIDNVLWGGKVADPAATGVDTVALRELNRNLKDDARFDISMLPVGDGLTLARKR